MTTYVIEREVDGVGQLSEAQLTEMARSSNAVISSLGTRYRWVKSYITADKIYCIHEAEDVDSVQEHADRTQSPANSINELVAIVDPTTATDGEVI